MTETKGNKAILETVDSMSAEMTKNYKNKDYEAINSVCDSLLETSHIMGKVPKITLQRFKRQSLTHSLGNSKIGADTVCISVNCGLLCPMSLTGHCGNCNICYAKSQNRNYFNNTVPKNIVNQILTNKVIIGEISLHRLLFNTITDIYCSYSKNQVSNIKFLRFNVEGDFLDNEQLKVFEGLADSFKTVFDLKSVYTYTHNKKLDFKSVSNIVFNTSDFKDRNCTKSVHTLQKLSDRIIDKIYNKSVILCNGNCTDCSYCKNRLESRPIYFLAHGGGFEGIKAIPTELKDFIETNKKLDNMEFLGL